MPLRPVILEGAKRPKDLRASSLKRYCFFPLRFFTTLHDSGAVTLNETIMSVAECRQALSYIYPLVKSAFVRRNYRGNFSLFGGFVKFF